MEDILTSLGLEDLSEEEQQTLLLDIQSLIFKGTMVRILEKMNDEEKEAFNAFLESDPSEDEMMSYMEEKVPQAKDAALEAISELKNDILAGTQP